MMTVQIWNCLLHRRKEHGSSLHSDAILKEIGKKVLRELDTDRIDPHKDVIKENWIHIFFFFVANNSYLNHHYLEADSSAGGASVQARAKSHREYRHICPISCCWLASLSLILTDMTPSMNLCICGSVIWVHPPRFHTHIERLDHVRACLPCNRLVQFRRSYASQGPPRAWTPSCPGAWYLVGGKWRNWHKHRPVLKSFARKTVHL